MADKSGTEDDNWPFIMTSSEVGLANETPANMAVSIFKVEEGLDGLDDTITFRDAYDYLIKTSMFKGQNDRIKLKRNS